MFISPSFYLLKFKYRREIGDEIVVFRVKTVVPSTMFRIVGIKGRNEKKKNEFVDFFFISVPCM